jgi:hypothetical protein
MMSADVDGSRFPVGQQDWGTVDHCPGDTNPLLLPTGKLVGHAVQLVGESHQLDNRGDPLVDDVLRAADDLQSEGDVLTDRLVGQELEVLEHAADIAAQVGHTPPRQLANVLAGYVDGALAGLLFF